MAIGSGYSKNPQRHSPETRAARLAAADIQKVISGLKESRPHGFMGTGYTQPTQHIKDTIDGGSPWVQQLKALGFPQDKLYQAAKGEQSPPASGSAEEVARDYRNVQSWPNPNGGSSV